MQVTYLDHMGNDSSVVDAARVSFNKKAAEFTEEQNFRLLRYLAANNHWSPFAHCTLKVHVKAPIFVARQLAKHQVGFSWNEVSRRYVSDSPEFYTPSQWRGTAENVKQGSGGPVSPETQSYVTSEMNDLYIRSEALYSDMLSYGVCPEQARMVLPQSMYTEWVWSGTLFAWARMCKLRLDKHTQEETRAVAAQVSKLGYEYFPQSWQVLMHYG